MAAIPIIAPTSVKIVRIEDILYILVSKRIYNISDEFLSQTY